MNRRKKHRWLGRCLVLAGTAALLTGCGHKQEESRAGIRIGVSLYDQYDTFISQLMEDFNEDVSACSEQNGIAISIDVMDAALSQSTQNDQVRTMIERGCDLICVNLVDRTEPTTITDLAEKSHVPVIFFNRELVAEDLERWDQLYYVGADAFQSGILQGQIAADLFLKTPQADRNKDQVLQYVSLEGEAGHQDAIVRTEYSIATIMDMGIEVEKLSYAIANWNRAQAKTQFESMLEQHGDQIELVLANNDDMALGAIDALKGKQIPKERWPLIVGIDGTREGLQAVRSNEMAGTVYNDRAGQARGMLDLAYAIITGGDLTEVEGLEGKYIRLPYQKILPDNVDAFC